MRIFRYIFGYMYPYGDNEREDKIVDKKWSIPMGLWDGEDEEGKPFSAGGVLLYVPLWYAQFLYRRFHKKNKRKSMRSRY